MTSSSATTPRALSGLPPRRSLGADPGLALLRRDRRPEPTLSPPDEYPAAAPPASSDRQRAEVDDPAPEAGNGGVAGLPPYLRLARKEARIREDQVDQLAEQVRRLNRARKHRGTTGGERITDNTLIRVAIDLLLQRADLLAGATEEELRNSVSP